jgi:hypothetical protein
MDPHWPGDVLERHLAEIDKMRVDPAAHVIEGGAGDKNAAGLADAFEARRDIDSIAEDVVALDQHVA